MCYDRQPESDTPSLSPSAGKQWTRIYSSRRSSSVFWNGPHMFLLTPWVTSWLQAVCTNLSKLEIDWRYCLKFLFHPFPLVNLPLWNLHLVTTKSLGLAMCKGHASHPGPSTVRYLRFWRDPAGCTASRRGWPQPVLPEAFSQHGMDFLDPKKCFFAL